jgi:hypothetical protein
MLADWFVVAVEPQAETAVSTRAKDLNIDTYYPQGRKLVRGRRSQLEARPCPAMPGSVFVLGKHFASFVRHLDAPDVVPHCIGWLTGSDGPEPVKPKVVEDIRTREAKGEFDAASRQGRYWGPRWLKPNVKVRITDGPFSGKAGDVWRVTAARRVAIWVQILGGQTLTECDIGWVARAR